MALYRYAPLDTNTDEIRLVRLLPGNLDDDIGLQIFHAPLPPRIAMTTRRASLEDVQKTLPSDWDVMETLQGRYLFSHSQLDLDSWDHPDDNVDRALYALEENSEQSGYEPDYEAMSYCWGSQADTSRVLIATTEERPSMYLDIGHNLACAMQHLRYSDKPRVIWIDAICINQLDLVERNQQVKRMARIYSSASRVVIWLGEASSDSLKAMESMRYIATQVESTVDGFLCPSPGCMYQWWNRNNPIDCDQRAWAAMATMLQRPWFFRVWVLQEVFLANKKTIAQCGCHIMPWYSMRKALHALRSNVSTPLQLSNMTSRMGLAFNPGKRYFTIPRLLQAARGRQSTDLRDKVYGVLSLAPPSIQEAVLPQYALSPQDVYQQLFFADVNSSKRIDTLGDCRLQQVMEGFPTWLPNWTTPVTSFFGFDIHRSQRMPAGLSACRVEFDHPSPRRITVCGVEAGQVQSVGMLATSDETGHLRQTLRSWESEDLRTAAYPAGGSLLHAYLEVIFMGCTHDRFVRNGAYLTIVDVETSYGDFMSEKSASLYMPLGMAQFNRVALFTTKTGYMGLGPAGVEEGLQKRNPQKRNYEAR